MKNLFLCLMMACMCVLSSCAAQQTIPVWANECCSVIVAVVKKDVKIIENVMFDWDKDIIRSDQQYIIDEVVKTMNDNPELNLILKGHASTEGESQYNLDLSLRRVKTVRNALMAQGVSADRINKAEGLGETDFFGFELFKNRKVRIISQ